MVILVFPLNYNNTFCCLHGTHVYGVQMCTDLIKLDIKDNQSHFGIRWASHLHGCICVLKGFHFQCAKIVLSAFYNA